MLTTEAFDPLPFLRDTLPLWFGQLPPKLSGPLVLQLLVPGRTDCRTFVELSPEGLTVKAGFAPKPDVTLSVQLPELAQLAARTLNLQEAIGLGRVKLYGDPKSVQLLGAALTGGGR